MALAAPDRFSDVDIEAVRDYWNRRPCNIRHSDKKIGTKEYFDEVEARKYFVEPHIPLFAGFDSWKGKRVLEIGCGIGTDTVNFARAVGEEGRITAVDLSEKSLELAKKRMDCYGLKADFYNADAEELSAAVPVEEYDLIYSFGVIHHSPYPEKVMAEIKKYMGKNSELRMMVYNRYSWKVLWIMATYGKFRFRETDKWVSMYSEAQTGCPVTYSYSKKSVKKLLSGFEIKDMFVEHVFPYQIKAYKKYQYKKVWYFRFMPKPLFRWLEKKFGWHLCVTAKIKK